jgi:hypothetical protein
MAGRRNGGPVPTSTADYKACASRRGGSTSHLSHWGIQKNRYCRAYREQVKTSAYWLLRQVGFSRGDAAVSARVTMTVQIKRTGRIAHGTKGRSILDFS